MYSTAVRPVIAVIIFSAACHAYGQIGARPANRSIPVQVNGQVRYSRGGAPADHVLVRLEGFKGGVVSEILTDRTGKFSFSGLLPDQYTITVHAQGFQEAQQHVDLQTATSEYVLFQLVADQTGSRANPTQVPGLLDANVPAAAQKEFDSAQAVLQSDKKESIEEGIRHLEKAVSVYPKFAEAQLRLGTAYMDLQQREKAEQALKKTLEIDPKAVNALFALGEVYRQEKKYEQAEKTLQDGLAIDSRSAQAHLTLARVYWDRVVGVKEEAKWRPSLEKSYQEVSQALQLDPNLAGAHLLKGNLYFKVHRAEDALHEFEEYLRLDPNGQFADPTRALAEKIKKALAETKKY